MRKHSLFEAHLPVLVVQLVLLISSSTLAQQECSEYINITDNSRSVSATGLRLCDSGAVWTTNNDWIRFPISGETWMPEYCPPTHACNTDAPVTD
ncbi:hypothetical protein ACROYT_G041562 [Oculina patagonica]